MMELFQTTTGSWNDIVNHLPGTHLFQSWEWAQLKADYSWQPMPYLWKDPTRRQEVLAAAMVLRRSIPVGGFAKRMCVLYVPKGPLLDWQNLPLRSQVLTDLQALAKEQGAIFIKIDPDVWLGTGFPGDTQVSENAAALSVRADLEQRGWLFSCDQIQFRNTVLIDLAGSEEDLLMRMKQKTRYNIRLAEKKGVKVRLGSTRDLELLYHMYAATSVRDGFVIRDASYYHSLWRTFMSMPAGSCQPYTEALIAEIDNRPVAALFLFYFAGRAYYLNGMSLNEQREKMPNYLLQWEAMKRAKQAGCSVYDLWGAPDKFEENDPMWGVYRFKEGLGGMVHRGLGAWDHTPNSMMYRLYTNILPRVLNIMRSRGMAATRQSLD